MRDRTRMKNWIVGFVDRGGLSSLAVQIFAITAALMIASLILMSFALSSLKASRMQSEVTENTLLEITTVEARLLDSDRMLNGYAIHGDAWYAVRAEKAKKQAKAAMEKLSRSVAGDAKLFGLYKTAAARLAERQAVYDYLFLPQHRDEVANTARSAAALSERNLTEDVRGKLWNILLAERAKRFAQHSYLIREAQKSFWIAVGVTVLSIFTGLVNLLLIRLASMGFRPR
jgi:hypothetical protein